MFDIDRWQEIFSSIRSNVLRTILSGFTVALGLYIFIVLFGIGSGLQNAFTAGFARDAQNLITIFTGKTTLRMVDFNLTEAFPLTTKIMIKLLI
jgi:putative ABC transport system permease protein